jgi:large subunit ribosomal protein L30
MAKVRITQFKSGIGASITQKRTLEALGLRKLNQTVEHNATPQIMGMANKLKHLVRVEEV